MEKTKIQLVDDHPIVIEGIKSILLPYPDFEVVGEAHNGHKALEDARLLRPDVVILDISMPDLDGIETAQGLKKLNDKIAIIIYTLYTEKKFILKLFRLGICAYIFKGDPYLELVKAIFSAQEGKQFFSPTIFNYMLEKFDQAQQSAPLENIMQNLSRRELEVLPFLARGIHPKEIAEKLFISPKTVEVHRYNILQKLKIRSQAELTMLAIKHKLIEV